VDEMELAEIDEQALRADDNQLLDALIDCCTENKDFKKGFRKTGFYKRNKLLFKERIIIRNL
jgi:hypothetical protein